MQLENKIYDKQNKEEIIQMTIHPNLLPCMSQKNFVRKDMFPTYPLKGNNND
jgi:hypothetical protein